MQIPLQLTFQGIDPSVSARAAVEHEVELLEKHNSHLIGCRVSLTASGNNHHNGSGFQVHIWLTIPPHENIVVDHAQSRNARHEKLEGAIKNAFAAARRQIDDLAPRS